MRVLYIEASPRKERSYSIKAANAFFTSYKEAHPKDEIDKLDLWKEDLPPFDGAMINAKYTVMHGKDPTAEEKKAWDLVKKIAERFKTADKIVLAVPMWNFGIPYRLKHYIDIITQPGVTFQGNKGLVPDKPTLVIYSSGGSYRPGSGGEKFDLQKPYLRLWLGYVGITNVKEVVVDGTMSQDKTNVEKGIEEARNLGKIF